MYAGAWLEDVYNKAPAVLVDATVRLTHQHTKWKHKWATWKTWAAP